MSGWSRDELDSVGGADELELTALRPDGTTRNPVTIWAVRVGEDLYARSWRAASAGWHRAVQARPEGHISAGGVERDIEFLTAEGAIEDVVDKAFRTKYGRYPDCVEPMVSAGARATTLRFLPPAEALG